MHAKSEYKQCEKKERNKEFTRTYLRNNETDNRNKHDHISNQRFPILKEMNQPELFQITHLFIEPITVLSTYIDFHRHVCCANDSKPEESS